MSFTIPEGSRPIPIPLSAVRKLTNEETIALRQRLLVAPPPPESVIADNHPSNIHATLQKNGQTIATVYKSGAMMTPDAIGLPASLANEGTGLPLAEQRLQQMLQLHGGTISYARQAATPSPERAGTLFAAQLAGANWP